MFHGSQFFYYGMYLVGFALMMLINLKDHDRYQIAKKDAVLYTLYTYICGIVGAMIMGKIYSWVYTSLGFATSGSVAIFGAVIFTPFLILLFPIKRKQWKNIMDMLTPGILLILACAKLGCFINGCCQGIVCDFGIHYQDDPKTYFPVQIFEVITMLVLLGATRLYIRKSKRFVSGTAYPITFGLYSITRFIWEYYRYYWDEDMRHVFFGFDFWQIICVMVLVICIICIVVLRIKAKNSIPENAEGDQ